MQSVSTPQRRTALGIALAFVSLGAGAQTQGPGTILEAITVVGESPVEYKPAKTRGVTFTDTPVKEIPQSISVITRDVLEDMGESVGLDAALELGGVGRANNYAGSLGQHTLRGFGGSTYYRNGMSQGANNAAAPDASGVESLDVMRGPSSLTLGAGDPGGSFNIVSKQPLEDDAYEFGLALDTHGGRRGTADLTGPLNSAGTLLYRINLALNDSESFRDHTQLNREYVAPRFTLKLAPQTRAMLDVEWLRAKAPLDRGIPIYPNLLYGPPSRSFFHGEPAAKRMTSENLIGQLRLEHAFSDDWSVDVGLQRITGDINGESIEINALLPDRRSVRRRMLRRFNGWNSTLAQSFLKGKVQLLSMEHQLLLGAEYRKGYSGLKHWYSDMSQNPLILDVYDPVYGATPLPEVAEARNTSTRTRNQAWILQDQIRVTPHLSVLAGLRYETFTTRASDYFANTFTPTKNKAFTPRLGGSYHFSDAVTGYVSHARSFKPTDSLDASGNTFKPERGTSWEAGLKTDLFDKRLQVTTALFHIVKSNVLTEDPNDANFRIAAGEVRSRGVDIDVAGHIGSRTRMAGYLGWVDAEVTKDTTLRPGAPVSNVPKFRARLIAFHQLSGALQGMEVGAGWSYVGHRVTSSTASALHLPSYSTVDLMANYQINHNAKIRLSLKNVFDRHYFERNFGSNALPGEPRALYASLEYKL